MSQKTYSLLDFGNDQRLEQWGQYRLIRPDPTAIGMPAHQEEWIRADAIYQGDKGKGVWQKKNATMSDSWQVQFDDLQLEVQLTPYKHTGVFPEQQQNWNWARATAQEAERSLSILHLFAYTGAGTVALAKDGHFVTHVDASKPAIAWAKENAVLNSIANDRVRWILEDAPSFVAKEVKRGKKYDAIILDPPAYGHGDSGKTWRVERDLAPLLEQCCALFSYQPVFLILNGYAHGDTPQSFDRLLKGVFAAKIPQHRFHLETADLSLHTSDGRSLSTGTVARVRFYQS